MALASSIMISATMCSTTSSHHIVPHGTILNMNEDQFQVTPDLSRLDATSPDMSRHVASDDDYISIKDARQIFISKGRSITERTLQRYCEKQQLDAKKMFTAEGEKWFVRESSVYHCIKELDKFDLLRASRHVATSTDVSSPVAELNKDDFAPDKLRQKNSENVSAPVESSQQSHTTCRDLTRPVATYRVTWKLWNRISFLRV
jgi:hypothetical protein